MNEEYISGGYIVTQLFADPSPRQWMQGTPDIPDDLLPERIISVGLCGAPHAPLFSWLGIDDEYARFGISNDRVPELSDWTNQQFDVEIGYPNIFWELATAQEYVQRFTDKRPDIRIIGLGLHKENLARISELENLHPRKEVEGFAPIAGFEDTGFAKGLNRNKPCLQGEALGFDVICCDYNIDHSWHCNGLAVDALENFNFRPNQFGLIDDKTNADKLAHYADEIQPEPGVWLPVLVTRYPLPTSD